MFLACRRDDELEEFTNRLLKDEPETFRRRLVTAMSRLTESQWEAVSSFVDGLAEEETWNGKTREQLHAELDQALDAEKECWTAEQAEAPSSSRDTMADAG